MGKPGNNPSYVNQTAFEYTSTQSIFTLAAGPVQLTVTFLSGVTPRDLLRSSLPYTYMNVAVQSTDGEQHSVQIYTDISAEWVSGNHAATAQWSYGMCLHVDKYHCHKRIPDIRQGMLLQALNLRQIRIRTRRVRHRRLELLLSTALRRRSMSQQLLSIPTARFTLLDKVISLRLLTPNHGLLTRLSKSRL